MEFTMVADMLAARFEISLSNLFSYT